MKKVLTFGLAFSIIGSVTAYAASIPNPGAKYDWGTLIAGTLNKTGSTTAQAYTAVAQNSAYSSFRAYAYLTAVGSNGANLSAKDIYGGTGGTLSSPATAIGSLSQSGASKWGSTHRVEKVSTYQGISISN